MSVRIPRNRDLSPLEGFRGLSLCLNAPSVRAVTETGGKYADAAVLALLDGGSFTPKSPPSLTLDASASCIRSESLPLLSMGLNEQRSCRLASKYMDNLL